MIDHYTYEHPTIEHYTDSEGVLHEVHSYTFEDDNGDLIPRRIDYYTDKHGVMHRFYYCEHCNKPIEYTNRCGDHLYCSMKCVNEVTREEMKTWKPKKIREIRMVHL